MAASRDLAIVTLPHNENVTVKKEGLFFGLHHFAGVQLTQAKPTTFRCKVVKILDGETNHRQKEGFTVEKRFKGAKRTKICKNWILLTIRVNIREPIRRVFYEVSGCPIEVDGEQSMLSELPEGCHWMLEFRHVDKHDRLSYFILSQVGIASQVGMTRSPDRYLVFFRDGDAERNNKDVIIVNSNHQSVDKPEHKKKGTKK